MYLFNQPKRFLRNLFLPLLFAAVLGADSTGFATSGDAAHLAHQLGSQTIATLDTPGLTTEQREARFRDLLNRSFDLVFMVRIALGLYWRAASPAQQTAYLNRFGEYLVQTYAARLSSYSSGTMTVTGARQAGDEDVVVRTQAGTTGGHAVAAEWRVRSGANGYRIIDISIEGISLVMAHHAEFAAVVLRHGIDGLLASLRDQTAKT